MIHEYTHALQLCKRGDNRSCEESVRREIEAYQADGRCKKQNIMNYKDCIINYAAKSAAQRCLGGEGEAREIAKNIYK